MVMVAGSDGTPTAATAFTVAHVLAFARQGIGVLAFDKRGLGSSRGRETGVDFAERAADVRAALRAAAAQPETSALGLWGVSQAGWVIPQALAPGDGVRLVALLSPPGVSPAESTAFMARTLVLRLGFDTRAADEAEALHRAVLRYQATGQGFAAAAALLEQARSRPWFERFRQEEPGVDMLDAGGRLPSPGDLADAWRRRPDAFAFARAPSTFADYAPLYRALDRPTLIVQGEADQLIPVAAADRLFAEAFRAAGNHDVEIRVVPGASHALLSPSSAHAPYLALLADWAARHFTASAPVRRSN